VIDLRAVVDVEEVDGAIGLVDPVGAAAGSVTSCEGAEQRFADGCGLTARAAPQNSSTAAATVSGSRWAMARRAAGWNRIGCGASPTAAARCA